MDSQDVGEAQARQGEDVVEVSLAWGDRVLGLVPLGARKEFFLGEAIEKGRTCDVFLPEEILGARRHRLLWVDAIGSVHLSPPRTARGWVRLANEMQMKLEDMPSPSARAAGELDFVLPSGSRVHLDLGEFVLTVRALGRAARLPRGIGALDARVPAAYFASSLAVFAGLFGALAYVVPHAGLEEDGDLSKDRLVLLQQYMVAAARREEDAPKPEAPLELPTQASGPSGEAAAQAAGAAGTTKPTTSHGRFAVQQTTPNPDEVFLARVRAKEEASLFGMIGLLSSAPAGDPLAPTSPFGRETALGDDPLSANGAMWGDTLGEAGGSGGLSLLGAEEGGGRTGRWIGMDGVNTIGPGSNGPGPGVFGSSNARPGGVHKPKTPTVRVPMSITTSGHLPAEIIQRTVRQNFGRFRMCYQAGLTRNPSLEGRVSVRFVIGRDGAVSNVGLVGAGMPDASVNDCLRASFYGISFTRPDNGIVQVTYPLLFSPE